MYKPYFSHENVQTLFQSLKRTNLISVAKAYTPYFKPYFSHESVQTLFQSRKRTNLISNLISVTKAYKPSVTKPYKPCFSHESVQTLFQSRKLSHLTLVATHSIHCPQCSIARAVTHKRIFFGLGDVTFEVIGLR